MLTKARWLLLKRPENLTERQEPKLRELVRYNLQSVRAYLLKEEFQLLWTYVSPAWAGKFIDRWTARVMRSRIEPLKREARTIRRHEPLILNWFKAKGVFSSGIVEGLNNKAKLTMRKSYGFRQFKTIEMALYPEVFAWGYLNRLAMHGLCVVWLPQVCPCNTLAPSCKSVHGGGHVHRTGAKSNFAASHPHSRELSRGEDGQETHAR